MDFIQKRRKILPNRYQRFKDESSIFPTSINMSQKVQEVLIFLTSKMAKIVISYPFTANFFQTENTKCTIFEQNRLIACQTQEKNQKICWFGKL
jgi:hypothetical protein